MAYICDDSSKRSGTSNICVLCLEFCKLLHAIEAIKYIDYKLCIILLHVSMN